MQAIRKKGRLLTVGAVAFVFSAYGTEAKADSMWNATIAFDHWCYPCSPGNVGFSLLCPCRIAEPIIVQPQ